MKAYKGTRAAAPPVLNLDIKQRRVFRCTQRPFYPRGKNPSTHWNRRPDGLQNRSVHFGGKSLAPVGIRAPNHSARRLVAIPTKQSQLIKIIQLHNTKIPSIYLESRHDLQKKRGGFIGHKNWVTVSSISFVPNLYSCDKNTFTKLGSR